MNSHLHRFARTVIRGLLVVLSMIAASCAGTVPPTVQVPAGQAGNTPVAQSTTVAKDSVQAATETPWLPPPPVLSKAEGWKLYPQDFKPAGNAEVKPGYEPMRNGVAAINPDLENRLLQEGLVVNTARTVVLPEAIKPAQATGPESGLVSPPLAWVKEADVNCLYRKDCSWASSDSQNDEFTLDATIGSANLISWLRESGDPGVPAEGLYGYEYIFDLTKLVGNPPLNCIHSFSIDIGPVTPLDYDYNGTPDFGYAYLPEWLISPPGWVNRPTQGNPPAIEVKGNTLTVLFDPPLCSGTDPTVETPGNFSYVFGFASIYPPRKVDWQFQDINGVTYHGKNANALAPDYPKGQYTLVEVNYKDINCLFVKDCTENWQGGGDNFTLDATDGSGYLNEYLRKSPDPDVVAQGLYGYEFLFDLRHLVGKDPRNCIQSFSIDFGPVTPLDYDQNGTPDFGYTIPWLGAPVRSKPPIIEVKENTLTAIFDPPLCIGTDPAVVDEQGDVGYEFGFASIYPPRKVDWQIQDIHGISYPIKSFNTYAPDYPQAQPIQEIVSIAPVAAAVDPNQFNEEQLQKLFQTDGVILGMLVLETNAPDSRLPPGAYLERAYLDGDQGMIELIDVKTGQTVLKIPMLSKRLNDPSLVIPSASIFLGSKICLTCLWFGWYVCRDCFFWETPTDLTECPAILDNVTP